MAKEYIEREAILNEFAKEKYTWQDFDEVEYALGHIPAADVVELTVEAEPVKHGRWMPQIVLGQRAWDCSECKTLGSPHWKRCPVCEAKMDLEESDA